MTRITPLASCLALLLSPAVVCAAGWSLDVAPVAGLAMGDFTFHESDMSSSVNAMPQAGLAIGAHVRPRARWSGGVVASASAIPSRQVSSDPSGGPATLGRSLWRTTLTGRWHPAGDGRVDPWLGLELGLVQARDGLAHRSDAAWQRGPAAGLGAGLDFAVGDHLALGFELQALAARLPERSPAVPGLFYPHQVGSGTSSGSATEYGDHVTVTAGLRGGWRGRW